MARNKRSTSDRHYETATEAHVAGMELYKEKKYHDALRAFNSGLDLEPMSYRLLDNRSATYEKMDEFGKALKDAKAMININKTGAKGYLRAGKILQVTGKLQDASNVYTYGLAHADRADKDFKLLEELQRKTAIACNPGCRVDPVKKLPAELLLIIMEQLTFREILSNLRVSKGWRDYLYAEHRLWQNLDLAIGRKSPSFAFVIACVARARNHVTRLVTCQEQLSKLGMVENIARSCRTLKSVEIRHEIEHDRLVEMLIASPQLESLILEREHGVLGFEFPSMMEVCRDLTRLEIHSLKDPFPGEARWPVWMPNLQEIVLGAIGELPLRHRFGKEACFPWTGGAIPNAPNLRKIHLVQWRGTREEMEFSFANLVLLEELNLRGCYMTVFPLLPPNIEILRLCDSMVLGEYGIDNAWSHADQLKLARLDVLQARRCQAVNSHLLGRLLAASEDGLRSLDVSGSTYDNHLSVLLFAKERGYLDELMELGLGGFNTRAPVIEQMISDLAHLESLDISHNKVDDDLIKLLLTKHAPELKWLNIRNCNNVSRQSADFARALGVTVDYGFIDESMSLSNRLARRRLLS